MPTPMTRMMVCLYLLATAAPPAGAQVDQQLAQAFFKEAQALCERDDGRRWGVSICAPMVIADMRLARHLSYPAGVEDERAHAAYTGTVLAARSPADAIAGAVDLLVGADTTALEARFVRTFAYVSGPAYGLLLDASSPGWTRRVRDADDLATLVMGALAVQPATDVTASAARSGGAVLRAAEEQRDHERQQRLA